MNWYKHYKISRDLYNVSNPLFDFGFYGVQDDPYKKKPFGIGTGKGFNMSNPMEIGNFEGLPGDYTPKYNPGQFTAKKDDSGRLMLDRPTEHDGEDTDNNDVKRTFEGPDAFYSETSPLSREQQVMQKIHDNMKGVHNMGTTVPPIYSNIRSTYEGFN